MLQYGQCKFHQSRSFKHQWSVLHINLASVETNVSIIVACIPLLRPLFVSFSEVIKSKKHSRQHTSEGYQLQHSPKHSQQGKRHDIERADSKRHPASYREHPYPAVHIQGG